jgi:Rho GTPase-activating protein 21/23
VQTSTLSGDDNPSPVPKTQRKYPFGSRSPSGQSPVTKNRKAPQNLLVTSSSLAAYKEGSDKETNSPKQKSWKHFVTKQFQKMQPQSDSQTSTDTMNEGCALSQCTPVRIVIFFYSNYF